MTPKQTARLAELRRLNAGQTFEFTLKVAIASYDSGSGKGIAHIQVFNRSGSVKFTASRRGMDIEVDRRSLTGTWGMPIAAAIEEALTSHILAEAQ
jgi:hypothetical protein